MKKKMKMSAKGGKKELPPALQKAIDAKKAKAGKEKMSYGAKKKKGQKMSINVKKKGRV